MTARAWRRRVTYPSAEPGWWAERSGPIHFINVMAAAGLVPLPGMMTGQIVSGVDPEEAIKYQLLILFLIAVHAATRRLSDARHRRRLDRLAPRGEG